MRFNDRFSVQNKLILQSNYSLSAHSLPTQSIRLFFSLMISLLLFACNAEVTTPTLVETSSESNEVPVSNSQRQLDDFAAQLELSYKLLDNRPAEDCDKHAGDGNCFLAQFSLHLNKPINLTDWQIYFSFMSPIQRDLSEEFDIQHVNGDLHRLIPTAKFAGWQTNQSAVIPFKAAFWQISEFDVPPNFYVVVEGLTAKTIESTRQVIDPQTKQEILPFVQPLTDNDKHLKRTAGDLSIQATAQRLYSVNQKFSGQAKNVRQRIIPKPMQTEFSSETASLDLSSGIFIKTNELSLAVDNPGFLHLKHLGVKINENQGVPLIISKTDESIGKEGYRLSIDSQQIKITAQSSTGAFYGLQSIASLLAAGEHSLPQLKVLDKPRFAFRGFHLDVARNFRDKNFVLKLIEQMAAYKLNRLHLHLGDDEGWRLEIPGIAELTQIGAKRCHDLSENKCLLPQLGNGPDEQTNANAFYSIKEYQQILQAANARGIEVIPSFDMPGHSRAAVKSMQARYRKLQAAGDIEMAEEFLLSDPDDMSVYSSVQFYRDNTLNVCRESTYHFVEVVIDELINLHQLAGVPLNTYHMGADETAGAWAESPICKSFMQQQQIPLQGLSDYFVKRVAAMLASKNIAVAGWSDGLGHIPAKEMPANVQVNAWKPLFWDGHKVAHSMANKDWRVVVSVPDVTYFDFPYEVDPQERGYYWGSRNTNTRQVFELMPENLPVHAEIWTDRQNQPMQMDDRATSASEVTAAYQPMAKGKKLAGLQGHLWGEMIRSDQQAEYMIFPRIIALAERAWHKASWEPEYLHEGALYTAETHFFSEQQKSEREQDWLTFIHTLAERELPKLDKYQIHYRIPTVGALVQGERLLINASLPSLKLQYQLNEGQWMDYPTNAAVSEPQGVVVNSAVKIKVRAKTSDGLRYGRALSVKQ